MQVTTELAELLEQEGRVERGRGAPGRDGRGPALRQRLGAVVGPGLARSGATPWPPSRLAGPVRSGRTPAHRQRGGAAPRRVCCSPPRRCISSDARTRRCSSCGAARSSSTTPRVCGLKRAEILIATGDKGEADKLLTAARRACRSAHAARAGAVPPRAPGPGADDPDPQAPARSRSQGRRGAGCGARSCSCSPTA